MIKNLRNLLEEIPILELDKQFDKLEEIRSIHEHSIEEENSEYLFQEWGTYNCFEYALGLTEFPEYVEVKKQGVFF